MNASISDAEAPFSHLLRSRFHIKLVIACDPARHGSHSGGPCYMNEILVKCQYLCTYIRVAGPLSSHLPQCERRSSCHFIHEIIPRNTQRGTRACTQAPALKNQPRAAAMKCAAAPPVRTLVPRRRFTARRCAAGWPSGCSYSCREGHLSENELGCGRSASPGGLQREERRL